MPPRSQNIHIRVSPEEREAISRLAAQRDMNVSEYLLAAALGRLDDPGTDYGVAAEVQGLRQRIERLERLAFGTE